jgi:hypothetical protein
LCGAIVHFFLKTKNNKSFEKKNKWRRIIGKWIKIYSYFLLFFLLLSFVCLYDIDELKIFWVFSLLSERFFFLLFRVRWCWIIWREKQTFFYINKYTRVYISMN